MALGLCLVRAAVTVAVAGTHFTLGWMHSIEKTSWEEDWRVTPAGLVIDEARIHGSGAGMEPPDDAVLRDGVWHYKPKLPPLPSLVLAASGFTPDHTLCAAGRCQPLQRWIAGDAPVRLEPCEVH
jgi:hypothetical protein